MASRHYRPGYFRWTARRIPAGRGALCASCSADFALVRVLMGKLPFGAPPLGPANDFTLGYLPTFDPPGLARAARTRGVSGRAIRLPRFH